MMSPVWPWLVAFAIMATAPVFAQSTTCARHDALTVAASRVGDVNDPFDKAKRLPIAIRDKGDHWHVWWVLPPNVAGGTPELLIDKRSCAILKAYHSQ